MFPADSASPPQFGFICLAVPQSSGGGGGGGFGSCEETRSSEDATSWRSSLSLFLGEGRLHQQEVRGRTSPEAVTREHSRGRSDWDGIDILSSSFMMGAAGGGGAGPVRAPLQQLRCSLEVSRSRPPASAWGGGRVGGGGGGASVWSEGKTERRSEYQDIFQGMNFLFSFFPHCCRIFIATFTQKVQKGQGQGQGQVFPSSRHDHELLRKFEEKLFTQKGRKINTDSSLGRKSNQALFMGICRDLWEFDRNWKTHKRVPDDTTCIFHPNKSDWCGYAKSKTVNTLPNPGDKSKS